MSEEQEQSRRRVVVETPTSRREVEQVHTERTPSREGYSTGMVATVAFAAVLLTALLVFFLVNNNSQNDNTNINARITQATPLPRETVVVTQPIAPPTQSAPIIITPPTASAPPAAAPVAAATPREPDDSTIQSNISKKFLNDAELSSADVTASAGGGKVILTGKVATQALKSRAGNIAQSVSGVKTVDNKITVDASGLSSGMKPTVP